MAINFKNATSLYSNGKEINRLILDGKVWWEKLTNKTEVSFSLSETYLQHDSCNILWDYGNHIKINADCDGTVFLTSKDGIDVCNMKDRSFPYSMQSDSYIEFNNPSATDGTYVYIASFYPANSNKYICTKTIEITIYIYDSSLEQSGHCDACGTSIDEGSTYCSDCQDMIDHGAVFCKNMGCELVLPGESCSSCGWYHPEGEVYYCRECNKELEANEIDICYDCSAGSL